MPESLPSSPTRWPGYSDEDGMVTALLSSAWGLRDVCQAISIALRRTREVVDRCDFNLEELAYRYSGEATYPA